MMYQELAPIDTMVVEESSEMCTKYGKKLSWGKVWNRMMGELLGFLAKRTKEIQIYYVFNDFLIAGTHKLDGHWEGDRNLP